MERAKAIIEEAVTGDLKYLTRGGFDERDLNFALGWVTATMAREGVTHNRVEVKEMLRATMERVSGERPVCSCRMSTLFNVFCGEPATREGFDPATGDVKAYTCDEHVKPGNVQFPTLRWRDVRPW